jgi:hypothetical protein
MTDPHMPWRIAQLPHDHVGRPVPWFVAYIDGEPDFRVIGDGKIYDALTFHLCWTCGQHLGKHASFLIGPMCALNRVSAEPPSHQDCAHYSAKACPFLTTPTMRRRDKLPDGYGYSAGIMCRRNPGAALLWNAKPGTWHPIQVHNGVLIHVGEPDSVAWYAEGRTATRAEVLHSIDTGLPLLQAEADKEADPAAARAEITQQHHAALALVPPPQVIATESDGTIAFTCEDCPNLVPLATSPADAIDEPALKAAVQAHHAEHLASAIQGTR